MDAGICLSRGDVDTMPGEMTEEAGSRYERSRIHAYEDRFFLHLVEVRKSVVLKAPC